MAKAIQVCRWSDIFEKSDLKKTQQWSWIAMPIRFDGRGWRRLTQRKDFEVVFSGFVVTCEVAGLMPKKGLLVDAQGVVVDAEELSTKTGIRRSTFETTFEVLTDPTAKIGWLEYIEVPDIRMHPDQSGSIGSTEQNRTVPNQTEQDRTDSSEPDVPASEPPFLSFPVVGRGPKTWPLPVEYVDELAGDFPNLDVPQQCRGARAWALANPSKRKTALGMKRFLVNWMNEAIRRGQMAGTNGAGTPRADELDPADAQMIEEMFGGRK